MSVVRSFQEELLAAGFEVALPELIRVQRQARGAKDWDLFLHGPKFEDVLSLMWLLSLIYIYRTLCISM